MQVTFKRWCMKAEEHGLPLSINPKDVVSTEFFCPAYRPRWEGDPAMPDCTKVSLRKGKDFFVQGSVEVVTLMLNTTEAMEEVK